MSAYPTKGGKRPRVTTPTVQHAFTADLDDHCETPEVAYDDIVLALSWLAETLHKPPHQLRIWDPYFCAGAVVKNLASRGFPLVHNKNEDFYKVIEDGLIPEYDVLVTNPPYSGDHVERILRFCADSKKPWFLLVPNYVYVRPCYAATFGSIASIHGQKQKMNEKNKDAAKNSGAETMVGDASSVTKKGSNSSPSSPTRPFFLVPSIRYEYVVPPGVRRDELEVKTAPFLSFWYIGMQSSLCADFFRDWRAEGKELPAAGAASSRASAPLRNQLLSRPLLVGHPSQLPHNMRAQYDPTRRRLRKKQREAFSRKKRGEETAREEARALAFSSQPCRFAGACWRPDCRYFHAPPPPT